MGEQIHKYFLTAWLSCLLLGSVQAQSGDNLNYLLSQVEDGKTYFLAKANRNSKNIVEEQKGYYIRIIPAKYKVVLDTIELSPALNGRLDTSNYFIETEVLVLNEPAAEWKTASVSNLCMEDGVNSPEYALCLLKMVPKYQIIHRKFFPFKNILDTTNTDLIIPAKKIVVEREQLLTPARLERISMQGLKPELQPGEKLITIAAGKWEYWQEVVCPYGGFDQPTTTDIQQALKKQGYDVELTNTYDEQTRTAIHDFQADNMLEIGELSDETINRLGVKRERLITIDQ